MLVRRCLEYMTKTQKTVEPVKKGYNGTVYLFTGQK